MILGALRKQMSFLSVSEESHMGCARPYENSKCNQEDYSGKICLCNNERYPGKILRRTVVLLWMTEIKCGLPLDDVVEEGEDPSSGCRPPLDDTAQGKPFFRMAQVI